MRIFKYEGKEGWNRVQKLSSLQKFVKSKMSSQDTSETFIYSLGVTHKMLDKLNQDKKLHRHNVYPKKINDLIDVFTDCEYYNYYNIDRVLNGKVKRFKGKTPKQRLLNMLEEAKNYHRTYLGLLDEK